MLKRRDEGCLERAWGC